MTHGLYVLRQTSLKPNEIVFESNMQFKDMPFENLPYTDNIK
jgi:hypothetical protein